MSGGSVGGCPREEGAPRDPPAEQISWPHLHQSGNFEGGGRERQKGKHREREERMEEKAEGKIDPE